MNYDIKNDLILIREFFQLSQEEFAKEICVEKVRIARTEIGQSYPMTEMIDKVYNYSFKKGLKLNLQKELFYKDDINENHILLTHASKEGINGELSINKSRINNDFGKGFYCGDSYEKSVSFVSRYDNSCIYFIDFDPKGLKSVRFEVNNEWMLAIAYFRGKLDVYKNHDIIKKIVNKVKKADYIIAPIADNRMFQIIDTFIDGEITDEQCKHCLSATNLGYQYVFVSDKALTNIKLIEKCFVSSEEKKYYQLEQQKFLEIGNNKSKLARINYRGKGKYIDEVFNNENR